MSSQGIYKVVKIISPYQVVINAGAESNIKQGQRFLIYSIGDMVIDSDTGEELEQVEIVKGTGKIIHLQNKIATIESDMKEDTPVTVRHNSGPAYMRHLIGDTEETKITRVDLPFEEVQIGDFVRPHGR